MWWVSSIHLFGLTHVKIQPDNNEKKNSKSPKNQHKNANVSNGNDTSNSVKEKSSSESNESKKESPSKSKKKSSKDEPSTITSDGKVKSPKSESKKAKSPSKEGKQDSKSPRNNDKQSSPRDDKSLFENFDIDDDTPKSPRKRKRESGERIPTSNLSPRKKIKTKSNLDIQIQEDLKKKIALYAHLKPHRVIKKLLKKAPNKSKKYGEARKDFVNICVSKVRDDLETIFEVLIKSHNIKDDIVTLTE